MGEMLSDNWASLEICLLDGEVESIDKLYLSLEMDGVVSMIQLLLKNAPAFFSTTRAVLHLGTFL